MAIAISRNGWTVAAVCPPNSPLCHVTGVREVLPLRTIGSRASLIAAIRKVQPDLIVPCDDSTVFMLHEIHSACPDLRRIIEQSLGHPDSFPILESRHALQQVASSLGIRVPRGFAVDSALQAADCFAELSRAAVVKLDGPHGGEGVSVVSSPEEAAAAFRRARASTSALIAAKRALVNRDPYAFWALSRSHCTSVSMQEFIVGTPANIMVACWQGRLQAQVSVEALSCQGATGAANIVRRIRRPEFEEAARALAAELNLSVFFGLDFMIERDSDLAYLIEMNPRCTQLGHLQFADQGSLASVLCQSLSGRLSAPSALTIVESTIAFFPQARHWQLSATDWPTAFHDVPCGEDALIANLLSEPWPDRQWSGRLYNWFRTPWRSAATESQSAPGTPAHRAPSKGI